MRSEDPIRRLAPPTHVARIGSTLLSLCLLVGCTMSARSTNEHILRGKLVLTDSSGTSLEQLPNGRCTGVAGSQFSEFQAGAPVTIENRSGVLLAKGRLEVGSGDQGSGSCAMPFVIHGVPGSNYYKVTVANNAGVDYTRTQIEAAQWEVTLGLSTS